MFFLKKDIPIMMDIKPALALPEGLELVSIEKRDESLTVTMVSTQPFPCCPCCRTPATRVHSCYIRQVADLPCGGQQVRLLLQVRNYFCDEPACEQKIFAERLAPSSEGAKTAGPRT